MDCKRVRHHLAEIVENTLPRETKEAMDRHLGSCHHCADLLQQFEDLWQAWDDPVPVLPSPLFRTGLAQRIQALETKKTTVLPPLNVRRRWLRPLAAAASILMGILAGYHLGNFPMIPDADASEQSNTIASEFTDDRLDYFDDFPAGSLAESYLSLGRENGEAGL